MGGTHGQASSRRTRDYAQSGCIRWRSRSSVASPLRSTVTHVAGWLARGMFEAAAASEVSIDAGEVEHLRGPALAADDLEYLAHSE